MKTQEIPNMNTTGKHRVDVSNLETKFHPERFKYLSPEYIIAFSNQLNWICKNRNIEKKTLDLWVKNSFPKIPNEHTINTVKKCIAETIPNNIFTIH